MTLLGVHLTARHLAEAAVLLALWGAVLGLVLMDGGVG